MFASKHISPSLGAQVGALTELETEELEFVTDPEELRMTYRSLTIAVH